MKFKILVGEHDTGPEIELASPEALQGADAMSFFEHRIEVDRQNVVWIVDDTGKARIMIGMSPNSKLEAILDATESVAGLQSKLLEQAMAIVDPPEGGSGG